MKNFLQIWLVPVVLLSGSTLFSCNDPVDVKPTLTNAEVETLNFMIQEEKLARDVYTYFFDLYGLNIFGNISGSEQKHMDKVRDLMIAYDLEVNVPEAAGVFSIDALQTLYNDLILSGEQSLLDALIVGATIEDKDIF
ncbi:MAG: DUF2202 domain-containing protein, partial [Phaeodactylibacter sp.]|nr:DUF2202 domain-containing protein [Phaeodactylibacter sp.]